jgi:hypothetical protein
MRDFYSLTSPDTIRPSAVCLWSFVFVLPIPALPLHTRNYPKPGFHQAEIANDGGMNAGQHSGGVDACGFDCANKKMPAPRSAFDQIKMFSMSDRGYIKQRMCVQLLRI